ncbi:MAG: hypothetical protein C5B54_10535 [Acidobacteria bacterium]|nr:MAG: hypothetical protein C5B54_10535 [Acidobacteriota bacterium]
MNRKNIQKLCAMFVSVLILGFLLHTFLQPSEAARGYQYKVISIQGMTELRTQNNTEQGRMANIEKVINDQAAAGWEFMQADGYILYFRR